MARNESALICDFAQYYHIYDWKALPPAYAAVLAAGLPESSRSMRKLTGLPCDLNTVLLAAIADRLSALVWTKTKKGTKKPEMLVEKLYEKSEKKVGKTEIETFRDADAFEEARRSFFRSQ